MGRFFSGKFGMIVLVAISSVCSSLGIVYFDQIVQRSSPLFASGVVYLAAGFMFLITTFTLKRKVEISAILKHKKDFYTFATLRLLGASMLAHAYLYTPASKVVFFTKIEPYLVMCWMWLLHKEKPSLRNLSLLAVHISGALILSFGLNFSFGIEQVGDLYVVFALLFFAGSYGFGKKLTNQCDLLSLSAVTNIFAGLIMLVGSTLLETPSKFWSYIADPSCQINFFLAAFVGMFIGIGLWLYTVKQLEPWIASSLRAVGPVVAAPVAWYFYGQGLTTTQIVGAVVVIITSAMISILHKK